MTLLRAWVELAAVMDQEAPGAGELVLLARAGPAPRSSSSERSAPGSSRFSANSVSSTSTAPELASARRALSSSMLSSLSSSSVLRRLVVVGCHRFLRASSRRISCGRAHGGRTSSGGVAFRPLRTTSDGSEICPRKPGLCPTSAGIARRIARLHPSAQHPSRIWRPGQAPPGGAQARGSVSARTLTSRSCRSSQIPGAVATNSVGPAGAPLKPPTTAPASVAIRPPAAPSQGESPCSA